MAKKKNKEMIEFLDNFIADKEKQLIENNGLVPHAYDMLIRYHTLRQFYTDEVSKQ